MEKEVVNIYFLKKEDILTESFYKKFTLNYEVNHRRLFTYSKGQLVNNPHLDMNPQLQLPPFYSAYFEWKELNKLPENLSADFDMGVNNLDIDFDQCLLEALLKRYEKVYVFLRYNKNIVNEKLSGGYKILFKRHKQFHEEYLIEISRELFNCNIKRENIYGMYIDMKEGQTPWEDIHFNGEDLLDIAKLINVFSGVFFKVPIYANYNWMLYSQDNNICNDLVDVVQSFCEENDIICDCNMGLEI